MLNDYKLDIMRYFTPEEIRQGINLWKMIRRVMQHETLWAIFMYRFGLWLQRGFKLPIMKPIVKVIYSVVSRIVEIILGIHISLKADIGGGLYIGHFGGIWIGPIRMGVNCSISQEVTIGIGGSGDHRGVPEFGDRVWVGPGAKVYGAIKIGNEVAIGANAVVSKNLPDNAVALGNPARIISRSGSAEFLDLSDSDKSLFGFEGKTIKNTILEKAEA